MNYPFVMFPFTEDDGTEQWACEFPDLPGCSAFGDTRQEAIEEGMLAKEAWLETMEKLGRPIPTPSDDFSREYSGTFNLRVGSGLHRRLVLKAKANGTSLNQYCVSLLSAGVESTTFVKLPRTSNVYRLRKESN